ncbi:MAG: DUF2971 domain-containing protein [Clostridiales bacterium]|nr:DUF2971 domain-containing protein [Clostridiales bacterium]
MDQNISQFINTLEMYNQMMHEIKKSGGLFYQYRPCNRSYTTIYDIDNIRNGVAFARPPLDMNDPFDSQIGFSVEELCNECINMVLENVEAGDFVKSLLTVLLKNKILGRFAELLKAINDLKLFLIKQRRAMYQVSLSLEKFVNQYGKILYNKSPASVKQIITKDNFLLICKLAAHFENTEITEKNLSAFLQVEEILDNLQQQIEHLMNEKYLPFLRNLLSKMPISCFSADGWDCSLMWAHYANSYKGICIEYDFNQLKGFIGFVKQVQYSLQRPTILLKDMGIAGFAFGQEESVKYTDPNLDNIFRYLLTKDTCWDYEKEWRIITICNEPVSKYFFPVPFIKSITLGLNVDHLCKKLILDVCQEKEIECYQLKLGHDNFILTREKIDVADTEYDEQTELDYIHFVSNDISRSCESIEKLSNELIVDLQNGGLNRLSLQEILKDTLTYFESIYFLKLSCNRFCLNSKDLSQVPPELLENISQLESASSKFHDAILNMENIVQQALANGQIKKDTYSDFMKLIKTIKDMYIKYQTTPWHDALIDNN